LIVFVSICIHLYKKWSHIGHMEIIK